MTVIAFPRVTDPSVRVRSVRAAGAWTIWNISQNLTDRWGVINSFQAEKKPLGELIETDGLLDRLRQQMWREETFIVRKDGCFGVLFELEFCSRESEEGNTDDPRQYKPHPDVVEALLNGMKPLAERFPGVEFAVPVESAIIHDRPAIWAFAPDGLLDQQQRNELGAALVSL